MERRRFLGVVVAGSVSVGCVGCGSDAREPLGPVAAGNVRDVPVGHFGFVPGQPVLLARDADGLYALSTICPHEECDIAQGGAITTTEAAAKGLICNCHGSRFDANGAVTRGPASSPLVHYRVDLAENGAITVQGGEVVGAGVRIKPDA